jgi:hypothetical protein
MTSEGPLRRYEVIGHVVVAIGGGLFVEAESEEEAREEAYKLLCREYTEADEHVVEEVVEQEEGYR